MTLLHFYVMTGKWRLLVLCMQLIRTSLTTILDFTFIHVQKCDTRSVSLLFVIIFLFINVILKCTTMQLSGYKSTILGY